MRAEHHNGSDGDSGKDTSDEDGPRTEKTRESLSPPQQFNAPSTLSNSWDKVSLDGLGYLQNNADNLLGYLKTVRNDQSAASYETSLHQPLIYLRRLDGLVPRR